VDTIEEATGVKLYRFSHMTHGEYEANKVEVEMRENVETLIEAMKFVASKHAQEKA
ncbi:ABC transporter substrate-binding protein, partial [Vibrio parahaemolyticus]